MIILTRKDMGLVGAGAIRGNLGVRPSRVLGRYLDDARDDGRRFGQPGLPQGDREPVRHRIHLEQEGGRDDIS